MAQGAIYYNANQLFLAGIIPYKTSRDKFRQ